MAELKPVYLIHGGDDPEIDRWRARLKARAAQEEATLEVFDAPAAGPAEVAAAIPALTFGSGTRYLLAEGVEGWRAGDLEPIEKQLAAMPPDTVLVLFAREKPGQRAKKPAARLLKAVEAAGGQVTECAAPKPWELPKWVISRARQEGLSADAEAAHALVAAVGASQQQLARELEKLAVALHPSTELTPDDVAELAAGGATGDVFALADAIIAGEPAAAFSLSESLTAADQTSGGMLFRIVDVIGEAHAVAALLEDGVAEKDVAKHLGTPPWKAKKALARAKKAGHESLERALCLLADFEVEARGGGDLDEETAFSLTLARATAG